MNNEKILDYDKFIQFFNSRTHGIITSLCAPARNGVVGF